MTGRRVRWLQLVFAVVMLILGRTPAAAQSDATQPAAKWDPRDLNGVWSPAGSSIPNNDITDHVLPGQEIAFTPYGAERYRTIDHSKDATNTCGPAGYMRGIQTPLMPFQIVQNPKIISINMEYMYSFRLITQTKASTPPILWIIRNGWDTLLATGRATHSSSMRLASKTRRGWTRMASSIAKNCT